MPRYECEDHKKNWTVFYGYRMTMEQAHDLMVLATSIDGLSQVDRLWWLHPGVPFDLYQDDTDLLSQDWVKEGIKAAEEGRVVDLVSLTEMDTS